MKSFVTNKRLTNRLLIKSIETCCIGELKKIVTKHKSKTKKKKKKDWQGRTVGIRTSSRSLTVLCERTRSEERKP